MWRIVGGVVITAVLASGCGGVEATRSQETSATGLAAQLDSVPGLARFDRESVIRDEQIAAYQAWLREQHARSCMEAAGFEYWPALLYPADEAAHFDIVGLNDLLASDVPDDSAAQNQSYRATLTRAQLDNYYRTFMGEPLEVIEHLEANGGALPDSHKDAFGVGGCLGEALAAVGRIWDFRDQMADALDAVRSKVRQSPIMTEASSALEACALEAGVSRVSGPGALEEQYASGIANYAQFKHIESTCVGPWIETEREALIEADNQFFAEHIDGMNRQIETYGPLYEQSRTDTSFARAVAGLLSGAL